MNPETKFIHRIHSKLKQLPNPPFIYKTADRFRNGIPDVLYIGTTGILLWVEYKVHPNKPTKIQLNTINTLNTFQQNTAIITLLPKLGYRSLIQSKDMSIEHNYPWQWITETLGYNLTTATTT